jgi:hypothetical protein
MTMKRTRLLTIAVALSASVGMFAATAGASAPTKPLTEAQWRKKVNATCKALKAKTGAISQEVFADVPAGQRPDDQHLHAYTDEADPAYQQAFDTVESLTPPKSLKKKAAKFVAVGREEWSAAVDNPIVLVGALNPFPKSTKLANQLDVKECAATRQ